MRSGAAMCLQGINVRCQTTGERLKVNGGRGRVEQQWHFSAGQLREREYPSTFLPLYKLVFGKSLYYVTETSFWERCGRRDTNITNREKGRCFMMEKKTERWERLCSWQRGHWLALSVHLEEVTELFFSSSHPFYRVVLNSHAYNILQMY